MKRQVIILCMVVASMTMSLQAQVMKVPQWKALMGERGWPIYFTDDTKKIGILNTWGVVREVSANAFTDKEFEQVLSYPVCKQSVFKSLLFDGSVEHNANETYARLSRESESAKIDLANIRDKVSNITLTSVSDPSVQYSGTITESRYQERAAANKKTVQLKRSAFDQATFIKAIESYRSVEEKRKNAAEHRKP
ncbi:MAG: hypothetical protein WCO51_12605 [bacterium]